MNPKDQLKLMLCMLLFFALFLAIGYARAAEKGNLQIHLASEHSSGCDTCNEANYGFGYIGAGEGTRFVGGYYTNSWFQDSFYAGVNWRLMGSHSISVSVVGITGYTGTTEGAEDAMLFGEVLPMPLLHIDLGPGLKHLNLWPQRAEITPFVTYAPTQDGGVALLSLNHRF